MQGSDSFHRESKGFLWIPKQGEKITLGFHGNLRCYRAKNEWLTTKHQLTGANAIGETCGDSINFWLPNLMIARGGFARQNSGPTSEFRGLYLCYVAIA